MHTSGFVRFAGALLLALTACACVANWSVDQVQSPVRAVHVAVLHTGKVLLVAGSGNDVAKFNAGTFRTSVWDPISNTFADVSTPWDAFCSGHAFLGDGRLLVAGGTDGYQTAQVSGYKGSTKGYLFDPVSQTYQAEPNMSSGRWYPTLLTLGNGNVLAVGGSDQNRMRTSTAEIFNGTGWAPPIAAPTGEPDGWPLYPGLHLLADGRIFYSGVWTFNGVSSVPGLWNLGTNTVTEVPGLTDATRRDQGSSVLLPPAQAQKVMVFGGGYTFDAKDAVASTAIADLSKPNPVFTPGPVLSEAKMYVSTVILPNSTVLETGGSRKSHDLGPKNQGYTYSSQIYDPATGTLTDTAKTTVSRGYHSSAVLLPDGRVATFGNNPSDGSFELRIEIYTPQYAYSQRPVIDNAPIEMTYGRSYPMRSHGANPVTSAVLVHPMAVTHSTDTSQRLVDVGFQTAGDGARITIPTNPNLLPPGWYMLFARDANRTPSVARWVHVS